MKKSSKFLLIIAFILLIAGGILNSLSSVDPKYNFGNFGDVLVLSGLFFIVVMLISEGYF